ncbi:winged helix DNA-binding domain-containing protein [Agromyces subbeticus]|uniref:winged helix DNA-binding domain-containing protein n=1 Tax=Agromyces subbeticus TaxID=293890 RepID=UPI0003B6F127|nr:winged helix DNA-binding domain-containing protein [Agromyces subbeticus]
MPTKLASDARVRAARLESHGLAAGLPSIAAAVRRLGAVQAQDFAASKWVVGSRVPGSVAADVDAAIESRDVLRSWPMRGTLHLVPAESLRDILAITGPRIVRLSATRHRELGLDDEIYAAARRIAERELEGGRSLSRDELQAAWQAGGVETTGQRGYHLIAWLALDAVLCGGPVEGRGQRFVLLDEWSPRIAAAPGRDETLAKLFISYVAGHGPATVRDFAWWSGLTLTDARAALADAGDAVAPFDDERFVVSDVSDESHGSTDAAPPAPRAAGRFVLAAFDEYFLGYADRDPVCDPAHARRVVPGSNGVFQPTLVQNGRVVGLWRPVKRARATSVSLDGFDGELDPARFTPRLREWARFWGQNLGEITAAAR